MQEPRPRTGVRPRAIRLRQAFEGPDYFHDMNAEVRKRTSARPLAGANFVPRQPVQPLEGIRQ